MKITSAFFAGLLLIGALAARGESDCDHFFID